MACAAQVPPPKEAKITVGEGTFVVERCIGLGASAKCWLATDERTKEQRVVKVAKNLLTKVNFEREAAVMNKISSHPNIVHLFDSDFTDTHKLVLEFCPGGSLWDMQVALQRFNHNEVRYIMWQLLNACAFIHKHDVVHCDIKPHNVYFDSKCNVKLGDFGLAVFESSSPGYQCGTPNYIAPELINVPSVEKITWRVDIWSLGCLMFYLMTGTAPFTVPFSIVGTFKRISAGKFTFPEGAGPEEAKEMVTTMLRMSPDSRPSASCLKGCEFFGMQAFWGEGQHLKQKMEHKKSYCGGDDTAS